MTEIRPLLSRVADAIYWMARYIERAENIARYIGVNLNLQLDLPLAPNQQWRPLIDTGGDTEVFQERYGEAEQDNVIHFLAFDAENPNSIASCLKFARENARSVRESISTEMWAQINALHLGIQSQTSMPEPEHLLDYFRNIRLGCHMFQGITDATMSHDEPWHFLQLGQKLERADKTSRILDVKYFMLLPSLRDVGTPFDDLHWSAVLKSVSGFGMYRRKYGRILPDDVVEFLVLDPEFPRSMRFCVDTAAESLYKITGTPLNMARLPSETAIVRLRADFDIKVESVIRGGLHEFLDAMQVRMNELDQSLYHDFVARDSQVQSQLASSGSPS